MAPPKDKTVAWAGLYKVLPGHMRMDFAPFLLLYGVLLAGALQVLPQEGSGEGGEGLIKHTHTQPLIPLWVLITMPFVLLAHLLTHLATHWYVACDAFVSYTRVKTVKEATHVRVRPPPNSGAEEMVPLEREETHAKEGSSSSGIVVVGQEHRLPLARFSFQKTNFVYWSLDAMAGEYTRLSYPIEGPLEEYVERKGYVMKEEVEVARQLWGENVFDIPLPPFMDLFKEHAVAPFFVFQVLCVLLWSLDEYWYYSMFTLVLLVIFESTVCYQRQRSLEMLRSMRRPAYAVWVYREGKWQEVSTEGLLPGDVVSLGRMSTHPDQKEEKRRRAGSGGGMARFRGRGGGASRRGATQTQTQTPSPQTPSYMEEDSVSERLVPCDLLLVRGTCIVNEAMLTGESTPQLKEFVEVEGGGGGGGGGDKEKEKGKEEAAAGGGPIFSLGAGVSGDADVRSHVVFGGTKVLQLGGSSSSSSSATKKDNQPSTTPTNTDTDTDTNIHIPPDKGATLGIVLRTGFETSQGQLMRTILFATRRVTAGSAETAVFIGILLLFALAASGVVLIEGLKDEGRNRFKLLLHCIMIVTSVVPPELPMELSLAVTNSLAALTRALVYCTEPFRIPYAGKVTVCCFDKTGTLTSDDLVLRGIVPLVMDTHTHTHTHTHTPVETILPPKEVKGPALWVLAACHSLMTVEGRLAGDPMEVAAVEGLGWIMASSGDVVLPNPTHTHSHTQSQGRKDKDDHSPIKIHHRYPFNSTLRRMSVLASRQVLSPSANGSLTNHTQTYILTKGAPEAVLPLLAGAPPQYAATYLHHMGRGRRVLALAYRVVEEKGGGGAVAMVRGWSREEVEKGLTLAGLLIIDCPLKKDTAGVIRELRASNHRTVMITGDSALTAAEVARQVGMVEDGPERTLHLVSRRGRRGGKGGEREREMGWEPMSTLMKPRVEEEGEGEGEVFFPFAVEEMPRLAKEYSLCVGGEALAELVGREVGGHGQGHVGGGGGKGTQNQQDRQQGEDDDDNKNGDNTTTTSDTRAGTMSPTTLHWLSHLCPYILLFARVAPDQKEMLLAALNHAGEVTLMCGDGTNDVGALKQAHVGVSIINSPELEKRAEATSNKYQTKLAAMGTGREGYNSRAQVQAAAGVGNASIGSGGVSGGDGSGNGEEDISRLAQILAELREQEKDPSIVQLGDASIASPFTAKRTSIDCVLAVVRQGRCTLVTTLQVYKILALNCLVSAYMLSSLYLFGVKQGDGQMTMLGLAVAALFFFVSRAEPLERLSAERPPARIFCAQVCVSIVLQFVVHLGCLMTTLEWAKPLVLLTSKDPSIAPDGPFRPNLVNTAIFLLSAVTQVNTFTANYRGHPFMQSLYENKALGRFTLVLYGVLFCLALEVVPPANQWLQLVSLPGGFRYSLVGLLVLDTVLVIAIEQLCLLYLPV